MAFQKPELSPQQRDQYSAAINELATGLAIHGANWIEHNAVRFQPPQLAFNIVSQALIAAAVSIVRCGDLNGACLFEPEAMRAMLQKAIDQKMTLVVKQPDGSFRSAREAAN